MLNSMWGKFGQRLNKTQVLEFDDPQAFHRFLDTNKLDVRHVSVMNDAMVEVHYQYQDEDIPVSPHLNIFVAAFTICWARLRLYEALELLGNASCTMTPTGSFTWRKRGNPTLSWVITLATLQVNWTLMITLKKSCRAVPRIMDTKPNRAKSNAKCGAFVSTARAKPN